MTSSLRFSDYTLDISRDVIPYCSEYPSPDPRWTFTDAAGHEHHYDNGYPTLDYVIDASYICQGQCGYNCDGYEVVTEAHYECSECVEVVKPGELPGGTMQYMPGLTKATLKGPLDGLNVTAWLTEDEYMRFDGINWQDREALDTLCESVLRGVPPERIESTRWSSR